MQEKAKRSAVEEPELIQESVHSKARGVRRGAFAGGALLTAIGLAALAVLPSNIEGAAQVADPMPAVSPTPERANAVTRSNIRTQVDVSETPTPSAEPSVTPTVQPSTSPSPTPAAKPSPSSEPSASPSNAPSVAPSAEPSVSPSPTPTSAKALPTPTPTPTQAPVPKLGKVTGEMMATSSVNVRRGPGASFEAFAALKEGGKVAITDVKVDGWQQVKIDDKAGFVSAKYLDAVPAAKPSPSPSKAKPSATPSTKKPSSAPTSKETTPAPAPLPDLGKVAGDRWATSAVNVRQGPGTSYKVIAGLSVGQKVQITDVKIDGWQQIRRDGKAAYVSAKYLSSEAPATRAPSPAPSTPAPSNPTSDECSNTSARSIASGLTSKTRNAMYAVCAQFPSIKTYGGARRSDGYHGSGRAVDIMVSGDFGWEVANWTRANASRLGITEVIYAQRIWTTQRSSEGWRWMSDRGSVSANHYDHVHISVP